MFGSRVVRENRSYGERLEHTRETDALRERRGGARGAVSAPRPIPAKASSRATVESVGPYEESRERAGQPRRHVASRAVRSREPIACPESTKFSRVLPRRRRASKIRWDRHEKKKRSRCSRGLVRRVTSLPEPPTDRLSLSRVTARALARSPRRTHAHLSDDLRAGEITR